MHEREEYCCAGRYVELVADELAESVRSYADVTRDAHEAFVVARSRLLEVVRELEDCESTDADEADAKARILARFSDGDFTVIVRRVIERSYPVDAWPLRCVAMSYGGLTLGESTQFARYVEYVGPQPLVRGVSLEDAVMIKELLLAIDVDARIEEHAPTRMATRETMSEAVRHEVWKRDGGECVDCGARGRLEFDQIIPFSQGGSNTARNIELRCEPCNRHKGAAV